MSDQDTYRELKQLAQRVTKVFMVATPEELLEPLRQIAATENEWKTLVLSALSGLESVMHAASLPYQLTCDAVLARRFQAFHSAERIRGLKEVSTGEGLSPDQEAHAYDRAQHKMKTFIKSDTGSDEIRNTILNDLSHHMDFEPVSVGASELIVQSLVSTWGVFETFAGSFIIQWLNGHPASAKSLVTCKDLKNYFSKPVIEIDAIDQHGFDLTHAMGSVLFDGKKLNNLAILKTILGELFSDPSLQSGLAKLWSLNQKRHLFVHKRGIVDKNFIENTGQNATIGTRLVVDCDDLEQHIIDVQNAILLTLTAANII